MTPAQKQNCLDLAAKLKAVIEYPGGRKFVVDLFLATFSKAGMVVVDAAEWEQLKKQKGA